MLLVVNLYLGRSSTLVTKMLGTQVTEGSVSIKFPLQCQANQSRSTNIPHSLEILINE